MKSSVQSLRNGFTTGSAATAAAVAAFRQSQEAVELLLPSGSTLTIPIARQCRNSALVVKDGGDDPDVTTGMEILVSVSPFPGAAMPADHEERLDELQLVIRGATGIGIATRPGLAIMVGKFAINPGPRKMIAQNLYHAGCRGRFLVEIAALNGENIARQTMNPTLGIQGGISILGNSGIVRPYSNAAYAATIALQLKSVAAAGGKCAALTTGNRSAIAIARDFPDIPEEAIVRIGDFIHVAISAAALNGLDSLYIGCMPGKLFKYACGEKNTHAHQCKLSLSKLREFGIALPAIRLEEMDTMGELAHHLDEKNWHELLECVYLQARNVLQSWAKQTQIILILYDDAGRRIL